MKVVLVLALVSCLMAATYAQTDFLTQYALLNMMRGNRGASAGASQGQAGGAAAAAALAAAAARGRGGASASGGMGGLLGNGGFRLMAMSGQLGDTFRDMAVCNMLPRMARQMCMWRQLGM